MYCDGVYTAGVMYCDGAYTAGVMYCDGAGVFAIKIICNWTHEEFQFVNHS
jgi:hypothetical protein